MSHPLFQQPQDAPALYCLFGEYEHSSHEKWHKVTHFYGELHSKAEQIAFAFVDNGVRVGERCAFVAPTNETTLWMLLGCLRAGITAMPLSPRFPEAMVRSLVQQAGARYTADSPSILPGRSHITELPYPPLSQDATILCSSGSTGMPKMFLHTAEQHYRSALGAAGNIPFGQGDCWLASLPLYHVGGYAIMIRALLGGAAIAIPHYTSFAVERLAEALENLPVTHCSFVSTQLYHALRFQPALERLRRLKAIVLGGSAIPESLIRQALDEGLKIYTSYGSTEMASQITTTKAPEREELRTSGSVLPYRELSISPKSEILVRGATLTQGKVTEQGIMPIVGDDGWYHTGDRGRLDDSERLIVLGRLDNMFISGGENIYPEMIEAALLEHTDIVQAIVVPVAHEIYGSRPVAFLQREGNLPLEDAWILSIRTVLYEKLPRFAVPDVFAVFPQNILASSLKPSRAELQSIAESLSLRKD